MGRKLRRPQQVWELFKKNAQGLDKVIHRPYALLEANGISRPAASSIINDLWRKGYLKKVSYGGRELVEVRLLKLTLGEDILGARKPIPSAVPAPAVLPAQAQKEELPVVEIRVPAEKPKQPKPKHTEIEQRAEQQRQTAAPAAGRGVILFVDYYNVYKMNTRTGTEFPAEELLEAGRKYGELMRSFMFIPSHVPDAIQTKLRRAGHRIVSCPSVKDGGGDSVDKTIDEFARDFSGHPDVATFLIISSDQDFGDTRDLIRNKRKKAVVFRGNSEGKALLAEDGFAVPLRSSNGNAGIVNGEAQGPSIARNIYNQILSGLEQGGARIVPESDGKWKVLKEIIKGLRERGWSTEQYPKGFVALCKIAWQDMRRKPIVARNATESDFSEAFTALVEHSIIAKRRQAQAPKTYYVFDAKNPLLKFLG